MSGELRDSTSSRAPGPALQISQTRLGLREKPMPKKPSNVISNLLGKCAIAIFAVGIILLGILSARLSRQSVNHTGGSGTQDSRILREPSSLPGESPLGAAGDPSPLKVTLSERSGGRIRKGGRAGRGRDLRMGRVGKEEDGSGRSGQNFTAPVLPPLGDPVALAAHEYLSSGELPPPEMPPAPTAVRACPLKRLPRIHGIYIFIFGTRREIALDAISPISSHFTGPLAERLDAIDCSRALPTAATAALACPLGPRCGNALSWESPVNPAHLPSLPSRKKKRHLQMC